MTDAKYEANVGLIDINKGLRLNLKLSKFKNDGSWRGE